MLSILQRTIILALSTASTAIPQPQGAKSSSNCWKDHAPLPGGVRQEHSVAAIDNKIYIVGGLQQSLAVTASVEVFDTTNNSWSSIPPMPTGLHHPNVAAVDGKLYVLGGIPSIIDWSGSPKSFAYDTVSGKWSDLSPLPNPRGSAAVGVHGKTIWLVGGLTGLIGAVNTVSSFDTVSGNWTSYPNSSLPEVRDHGGGAVIGDAFYFVGGRTNDPTLTKANTWVMDLKAAQLKWVEKAKMPTPRGGIAVAAVGSNIYTFGGEGNPNAVSGVFPDNEAYDTATDTWSKELSMKNPRHGMGAATVGNRIYIPAGGAVISGDKPVATIDSFGPGPC
jgi:N-acetylneuraminic acid mutarotase